MRLIGLAVVLAVCLTLAPLVAEAQQTGKVYRIGWLAPASLPTTLDAFRDGLRVFGYIEGNNLVIEQRYTNGKPERLAGLVAELVGAKADVIVTTGNQATGHPVPQAPACRSQSTSGTRRLRESVRGGEGRSSGQRCVRLYPQAGRVGRTGPFRASGA